MNFKTKLSIFATSLLMAACSSENVIDAPDGPDLPGNEDDGNRQEVELILKNTLNVKAPQRGARAVGDPIATDEENYIHSLDVYVFGSKEENGTYTFQELHYYRDDASEVNIPNINAYSFNLNPGTKDNTTSGLLKVNKGLFVKLYCVANRTQLYQTKPNGDIVPYDTFMSLEQSAPGQADNNVVEGAPLEEVFTKFHTKLIDPTTTAATEDDILMTPLPMTGAYTTPLDLTDFSNSARTQINFKLSRMVARFDVVNDSKTSKFTIEKISMGKGQKAAQLFPIQPLYTDEADLITYPEREISPETQKNPNSYPGDPDAALMTDVTKGAFYTWPSPKEDHGYLILKGKYAVNKTEEKDVTYQIPFEQIVDGVGTYIEVAYNHRYTIAITKADDYHLDFKLKVADWDEGEEVDEYEPENTLDGKTPIKLETDGAASVEAYVTDDGKVELLAADGSKFAFKMESNTALTEELLFQKGGAKWFKPIENGRPAPRGASMSTTYAYEVDKDQLADRKKVLPVTLRLTNPASGERKNITVIPAPGPVITQSADVSYSTFDPKTLVATLYNVAEQTLKLNAVVESRSDRAEHPTITTGSTATIDASATTWLSVTPSSATTAEETYELKLTAAQSAGDHTTVDFISTATKEKTQITVRLKSPKMETIEARHFNLGDEKNALDITGGTLGVPKVTLVGYKDNYFKLTVTSPEGVTAEVPVGSGDDWLEVETSAGPGLSNGMKTTVITGKISDATDMGTTPKTDGKIVIKNNIDNTETPIEVATSIPAGPTFSMEDSQGNLSVFDATKNEATIYNAVGQKITLQAEETCKVVAGSTDGNTWLTVDGDEGTMHTITINAAQNPLSNTGTVKYVNAKGGITEVTVKLDDPAIIAPTTVAGSFASITGGDNNTFTEAVAPDTNAKITMKEVTTESCAQLTLESPAGISVDALNAEDAKWLEVRITQQRTLSNGNTESIVRIDIKDDATDLDTAKEAKFTLKNAIANGGDLEIDVATAPVTPP